MDEDEHRDLVASIAAHHSLIKTLLMWSMEEFDPEHVRKLCGAIKDRAQLTEVYRDATKGDEAASERLADLVVRMQQKIDSIVDEAMDTFQKVYDKNRV